MPAPYESYPQIKHDVYDGIKPSNPDQNKGRVVFITGASKGLGAASAKAFAASGASLFLSARSIGVLEAMKTELEATFKVPVAVCQIDITKDDSVKAGVRQAVETYGKIDVVISNAGGGDSSGSIADTPPAEWWYDYELNLKGSYSVAHYTLPELRKTKGHIVFLSSALAQLRMPGGSSYNMAKMALTRLAEWIHIEENAAGVKAYAIHPGAVVTDLSRNLVETNPVMAAIFIDTPELEAWTQVRLTSGSEDWLSGRYYDSTWGFETVEKLREKIIEDDALKIRLALPHSA